MKSRPISLTETRVKTTNTKHSNEDTTAELSALMDVFHIIIVVRLLSLYLFHTGWPKLNDVTLQFLFVTSTKFYDFWHINNKLNCVNFTTLCQLLFARGRYKAEYTLLPVLFCYYQHLVNKDVQCESKKSPPWGFLAFFRRRLGLGVFILNLRFYPGV